MDVTPYLELKSAPHAVFDALEERRARPRFMVPTGDGDWHAVTWGAFAAQIAHVACWLHGAGLKPGERAVVFAPNRVEWMSAALGIQTAGGVMVPIYPASTAEQAAYVIEHADAKVVFVDTAALLETLLAAWAALDGVRRIVLLSDDLDLAAAMRSARARGAAPSIDEVEPKIISWQQLQRNGKSRCEERPEELDQLLAAVDLQQPALMLYTSGTTGNPKGVPLTHANVAANGRDWLECNASQLDEGAVDLLWLPMSHIFGFGEACAGNTLGWCSYMTDPANALTKLAEVKPTVFFSVPAYWEKLAQQLLTVDDRDARRGKLGEVTGGRLRFCLSGGAGLKREVKELLYDNGLLVIEGYGLTECSPTLTLNRPDSFRFDSVGKPLPSVELRLADDGEILARGPNVFAGYHDNPEATRECFTDDGWFKTGDVGRMTEDGFLQIVDRKKEILVTAGGKNVPPANIELRFADDAVFAHVVVYGDGKKYLTAGLWLNPEAVDAELARRGTADDERETVIAAMVDERVAKVNATLARYEQIKRYRIMDTPLTVARGLLTSTLKVRRKKVYEAFAKDYEALYRDA
jgi:long-chain acyl-CoA synthetase